MDSVKVEKIKKWKQPAIKTDSSHRRGRQIVNNGVTPRLSAGSILGIYMGSSNREVTRNNQQ